MYNFLFLSNESQCIKRWRLGLDQVPTHLPLLQNYFLYFTLQVIRGQGYRRRDTEWSSPYTSTLPLKLFSLSYFISYPGTGIRQGIQPPTHQPLAADMAGFIGSWHWLMRGLFLNLKATDPYRPLNLRRSIRDIFFRTLTRISMYVNRPRRHGRDRPHTVSPPLCPSCPRGLSLSNYHIRSVWGSGITQAIWAAHIGGFDLMILMETNSTY